MYVFYSIVLAVWIFFMLPAFVVAAIRKKKYLPALRERMGYLPDTLNADGRQTIWFHACSVGETLSLQPLAATLHAKFPDARLVFSAITLGGRRIAEERFAKYGPGNAFYFPIDEPLFINRVLNRIKPDLLIVVDTEIWPNTLKTCHDRGVPIALVNGRISAKSFKSYRRIVPILRQVFKNYDLMLMKAEEDAQRVRALGAPTDRIQVSGNIKYDRDTVEKDVSDGQRKALSDAFGLGQGSGRVIVSGSTHDGEEDIVFGVLKRLRAQANTADVRLMIAPRHPERFNQVAALAQKMGLTVCRRSANSPVAGAEVLLIDTLGELGTAYQFADIAFVGGTLIPHGGQSIMEPALYGKAIVIGRSMENFPNIIDDFVAAKALWQIQAQPTERDAQADQLLEAFTMLLGDDDRRIKMGEQALSLFDKSRGATAFTAEKVAALLVARRPSTAVEGK